MFGVRRLGKNVGSRSNAWDNRESSPRFLNSVFKNPYKINAILKITHTADKNFKFLHHISSLKYLGLSII